MEAMMIWLVVVVQHVCFNLGYSGPSCQVTPAISVEPPIHLFLKEIVCNKNQHVSYLAAHPTKWILPWIQSGLALLCLLTTGVRSHSLSAMPWKRGQVWANLSPDALLRPNFRYGGTDLFGPKWG